MTIEESRRRNEASMARKRANPKAINPAAANAGIGSEGPLTPSSTGAMDSLLEKLRAAKPQARDQRDRRRRARLKDKHQVRVASGQTIPDMGDLTKTGSEDEDVDKGLLSPTITVNGEASGEKMEPISEGEDVAERAASLLQGLRSDGDVTESGRPASRDGSGSLRVRRRRESADVERQTRRRRRARESTAGDEETLSPPLTSGQDPVENPIPEETEAAEGEFNPPGGDSEDTKMEDVPQQKHETATPPPPQTRISPPSPEPGLEGSSERPVVLDG